MTEDFDPNEPVVLARPLSSNESYSLAITPVVYARPAIVPASVFPNTSLSTLEALADLALTIMAMIVIHFGAGIVMLFFDLENRFPSLGILFSNIILGVATLAIVAGMMAWRKQGPCAIGLGRTPLFQTLLWTIGAIPLTLAGAFATGILYMIFAGDSVEAVMEEREAFFEMIPEMSRTVIIVFAMFTGVHEEIFFRGFVLSRCRTLLRWNWLAIPVVSLMFGLVHAYQGPMGVVQTTVIGLILGVVATYSRSLWPVIIAHAALNMVGLGIIPWAEEQLKQISEPTTTSAPAESEMPEGPPLV